MKIGLRGKLFAISLLLIAGVGVTVLLFFESRLRHDWSERAEADLLLHARTAAAAVLLAESASPDELRGFVDALALSHNAQVAIIDRSGKVRADSTRALTDATHPDLERAFRGEATITRGRVDGVDVLEVAAPYPDEASPLGAVWMRVELGAVDRAVGDLRALLALAALVGLAAAIFMSGVASELMARTLRTMIDAAVEGATGESPSSEDSGDSLRPASSRSFHAIAQDLQDVMSELTEERDRLETILEQMQDAVLVLDDEGRLTLTNDAANTLLAMDDDDVGRPLLEAVRAPALVEIAARSARGDTATTEFEMHRPKHRHVLAHAANIRNKGGVVIVMHDVTEIRRLERMRRDFVANVSHELRTPVAVIRANAETLLDGALDDEARAKGFVEGIHRSAERLTALLGDLLDLSKIEAGRYDLDIQPVALRRSVDTVMDGLVAKAGRPVEVRNEVPEKDMVLADTTGLSQILQNLLDNALKYAPEDGHVWVRALPAGDRVRIEVEDDGPGIEPHQRRRVFERFYRVDPGRSRALGGTGLGLSIVKHLAEQMGGTVGVEAAPKRGSLFWVELPIAS